MTRAKSINHAGTLAASGWQRAAKAQAFSCRQPPAASRQRFRGLTFIELMFATMILGVGMIIIAAAFPVAIAEQRATLDEAAAAGLERSAIRTLTNKATIYAVPPNPPPTGTWLAATAEGEIQSFGTITTNWQQIAGDLICPSNERYAWTAMWMKSLITGTTDQYNVTFFVVPMVCRDAAAFDGANVDQLKPWNVKITYYYKGTPDPKIAVDPEQDTITIEDGTPPSASDSKYTSHAAVEGAYVVRAAGVKSIKGGTQYPLFPGNAIIKLGTQFADSELNAPDGKKRFRISPGFEHLLTVAGTGDLFNPTDAIAAASDAWVVGRYVPPTEPLDETTVATGRSNRALSCRGITVQINDPSSNLP